MNLKRLGLIGAVLGIGLATSACTDGYGYSGVQVGYGNGGYYGDPYGGGYGYADPYQVGGFGSPYYGWYNDYYYPGTGIYVYDQYRRPYRWNNTQQRYWQGRRNNWRGDRNFNNNWGGFQRNGVDGRQYQGNRGYDGGRDGIRDGVRNYQRSPGVNTDGRRDDRRDGYRGYRGNRGVEAGGTVRTDAVNPSMNRGDRGDRGGRRGGGSWRGRGGKRPQ